MSNEVTVKVEFTIDLDDLHDALLELGVDSAKMTTPYLLARWNDLPDHIQADALAWGSGDTVFRENVFGFFDKNPSML